MLLTSLWREKGHSIVSILAIAAALVMMLTIEGFQAGLWHQVRAYREGWPVDLVELPGNVSTLAFTRVALPPGAEETTRSISGVAAAYPLVGAPAIFAMGSKRSPVTVIGYDGVGGPAQLSQGRQVQAPGEALLDSALAKRFGVTVGDSIPFLGQRFLVVGASTQTASLLGSFIFIHLQDAYAIVGIGSAGHSAPSPNMLLVKAVPRDTTPSVMRAISDNVAGVTAVTPQTLADNDVATAKGVMGSTMKVLVYASYLAGVLIIGATLYGATAEKSKEYGIVKALGAGNGRLYAQVLATAAVLTLAGFGAAVLVTWGLASALARLLPQYPLRPWDLEVLLRSGVAALILAALGAALPVRQVHDVEPAWVFR